MSDREQSAVHILARYPDGSPAAGAKVEIYLDDKYAGTVEVSGESLPTVLFPKSVKEVRAVAEYYGGRAEQRVASTSRTLALTIRFPEDFERGRGEFERPFGFQLPENGGRRTLDYEGVSRSPQARCPDGTTGYPCVKCTVGGNQITICV
jgi:hypothetical protein